MAAITVKVTKNNFPKAASNLRGITTAAKKDLSQRIVDKAQSRAKVDTGEMKSKTVVTGEGAAAQANHSGFIDYGTRYIVGDRWFTGSVDETRNEAPGIIGPKVKAAVEGAA